jgi:hypothetical protein
MTQLSADELTAAATALRLAGRWYAATRLLDAARPADPAEAAQLAVAVATVAADADFFRQADTAGPQLDRAAAALDSAPDPVLEWDLEQLGVQRAHAANLFGAAGAEGPALVERAERHRDAAPDPRRAAWAAFWCGVIHEHAANDHDTAVERYTEALRGAEEAGDPLVASYAERHLADDAYENGDTADGVARAERSLALRQRAGFVPGVLAQQAMVTDFARRAGDTAAARAGGELLARWAAALGLTWLEKQATALAEG